MGDLARHFIYGRQAWPGIFEPDSEIYYSGPRRQRELIRLSQAQIEAQKDCARGIAQSNLHSAQIVANEVQRQTDALEMAMGSMTQVLSSDIQVASSQITDAIVELGQQLSFELSEIRWQLAQQQETMERILSVLTNSRNNEAQQLVKQGLRHYQNDQYQEAEERFRKALEFDTTDYQVLMNLAYIEVHKDDGPTSIDYFHRALVLPEQLDGNSRYRAMWGIARVHYATGDFSSALKGALNAIKELEKNHEKVNPSDFVTAAGYAAQAGNKRDALNLVYRAIEYRPTLFAKVAAERELFPVRQEVLEKLSNLAKAAYDESVAVYGKTEDKVNSIKERKLTTECSQSIATAAVRLTSLKDKLKTPSYIGCLATLRTIAVVNDLLFHIDRLNNTSLEQSSARAEIKTQERLKTKAENTVSQHDQSVEDRESLSNLISGIIAGIVVLYCIISLVSSVKSASNIDERGSAAFAILTSWIWIPVCGAASFFVPRFLLKILFGTWWKGSGVKQAEQNQYNLGTALTTAKSKEVEIGRRVQTLQKKVKTLLSSIDYQVEIKLLTKQ